MTVHLPAPVLLLEVVCSTEERKDDTVFPYWYYVLFLSSLQTTAWSGLVQQVYGDSRLCAFHHAIFLARKINMIEAIIKKNNDDDIDTDHDVDGDDGNNKNNNGSSSSSSK